MFRLLSKFLLTDLVAVLDLDVPAAAVGEWM